MQLRTEAALEAIRTLRAGPVRVETIRDALPVDDLLKLGLINIGASIETLEIKDFHRGASYPFNTAEALPHTELVKFEKLALECRYSKAVASMAALPPGIKRWRCAQRSSLLDAAAAFTQADIDSFFRTWHSPENRLYPSAGALYPISLVVDQTDVGQSTLYRFDTRNDHVTTAVCTQQEKFALDAALGTCGSRIWLIANLGLSIGKYGRRGYRYALLEAGHAAQVAIQILNWYGFEVRPFGGYLDEAVARRLSLSHTELPVYALGVCKQETARISAGETAVG